MRWNPGGFYVIALSRGTRSAHTIFREFVPMTLAGSVMIALDGKSYEGTADIESAVLKLPFRKRHWSPADPSEVDSTAIKDIVKDIVWIMSFKSLLRRGSGPSRRCLYVFRPS